MKCSRVKDNEWVSGWKQKAVMQKHTGIVWLPCRACMAACASGCTEYLTKAQPLLTPCASRRTVHSSIFPKGSKRRRTSSSDCCLLSMPTNSLRSSARTHTHTHTTLWIHYIILYTILSAQAQGILLARAVLVLHGNKYRNAS